MKDYIRWKRENAYDHTVDSTIVLEPYVSYYGGEFTESSATILTNPQRDGDEFRIVFYTSGETTFSIAVDGWVNGVVPDFSKEGLYELSIVENNSFYIGVCAYFLCIKNHTRNETKHY